MTNDTISRTMQSLLPVFKDNCLWLMREMFRADFAIDQSWTISDGIDGNYDYNFVLTSKNMNFKSLTVVACSLEAIGVIFGQAATLDIAHDAFGECMNIYCAMMMDNKMFMDVFGAMRQNLPQEATSKIVYPSCSTVNGNLRLGSIELYIAYAIISNRFNLDWVLNKHREAEGGEKKEEKNA